MPPTTQTEDQQGGESAGRPRFEARIEGDPFVWGRGETEQEAIEEAKETLLDSGSKDIEGDLDRLVVSEALDDEGERDDFDRNSCPGCGGSCQRACA